MKTILFRRLLAILMTVGILTGTVGTLTASAKNLSPKQQAAMNNYHSLGLSSVRNARELGGYITKDGRTVKHGKLLRTGELQDATKKDLARLSKVYKVRKVIDFRTARNQISDYDPEIGNSELLWFNTFPFEFPLIEIATREELNAVLKLIPDGVVDPYMVNQYHVLVSDPFAILAYRQFFEEILDANGGTVLYHCSSGKDRTGVASYLLLSALGVPEKVAIEDYLVSAYYMSDAKESTYQQVYGIFNSKRLAKEVSKINSVNRIWLQTAIDTINREYGGINRYLQNQMGLSKADLKKLRSLYLEP